MADPYSNNAKGVTGPGERHWLLTASAQDLPVLPRAIYCEADGTITIRDTAGQVLPYTLVQGQQLPFRGVAVTAISGGTFYGWI
jgi:hypothetical protein